MPVKQGRRTVKRVHTGI